MPEAFIKYKQYLEQCLNGTAQDFYQNGLYFYRLDGLMHTVLPLPNQIWLNRSTTPTVCIKSNWELYALLCSCSHLLLEEKDLDPLWVKKDECTYVHPSGFGVEWDDEPEHSFWAVTYHGTYVHSPLPQDLHPSLVDAQLLAQNANKLVEGYKWKYDPDKGIIINKLTGVGYSVLNEMPYYTLFHLYRAFDKVF